MGKIDYQKIYSSKRDGWKELTEPGSKEYENFFAGYYSENNHFVYELLQNAEDAEATFITFVYKSDRLTIYHNGRPFNEMDVNSIYYAKSRFSLIKAERFLRRGSRKNKIYIFRIKRESTAYQQKSM